MDGDVSYYVADIVCRCMTGYLLTPRVLLAHFISLGLVYSLAKQTNDVGQFVSVLIKQEVVQLVLWLVLPVEGLATAISLLFCLWMYEGVVSTTLELEVSEATVFMSDTDLTRWLDGAHKLHVIQNAGGRWRIDTTLWCLQKVRKSRQRDENADNKSSVIIDLASITSVSAGCDGKMLSSIRALDVQANRCFCLHSVRSQMQKHEDFSYILIAETAESCRYWVALFQQMTAVAADDIGKQWLKKLVSLDWVSAGGAGSNNRNFTIDEAFSVLQKAKRNADRNYMIEVIKTIHKSGDGSKTKSAEIRLTLDEFVTLFKHTAITVNVQNIFDRIQNSYGVKLSVPAKTFLHFVLHKQKERASMDDVVEWIVQHEPVLSFGNLSVAGFANYIISDENSIFSRRHREIYQDMKQPLCHYFIATSHNTYLTKDQLKSKSSVDAYINALKRGCKCVELDCWDGPNNEPIIYHGHTLTSKILFRDVIQAIRDHAFSVSKYPVILSFENHCSVEQQKVMAAHLVDILGKMLHTHAIPEDETCLPSPEDLSGYVLVKAKKHHVGEPDELEDLDDDFSDDDITDEEDVVPLPHRPKSIDLDDSADTISMRSEMDEEEMNGTSTLTRKSSTLKRMTKELFRKRKEDKPKVPKIAQELSDLVTYCQATSFKSFEHSRQNCKHFEMSSFGEKRALRFAREDPRTFLQYNQRQLSRIYPAGGRVDSSNYDPMTMWSVGCQLVALNYQTACREMQMNQGLFQENGQCGYVLKPEFMRKDHIDFDPRGPFAGVHTLTIREIYGHQIPYKVDKIIKSERSLLIQVKVMGVEADNQVMKTCPVKNNGYNPAWEDELTFKIHVPELALVNFTVYTKEAFIAQYTLPFTSILQGYRKIPLQNKYSEPIVNGYLLAYVEIQAPI